MSGVVFASHNINGGTSRLKKTNKKKKNTKKLTIKAFKRKPKLPDNFEAETWEKLQGAVLAIYSEKPVAASREDLYRAAEDMCMHKMSQRLYLNLKQEFEKQTRIVMEKMIDILNNSSGNTETTFIAKFEALWSSHCDQCLAIRSIFLYLDRTYVLQNAGSSGIRSIWDMAVVLFRDNLAAVPDVQKRIVDSVLALVRGERNGESINRPLIQKVLRVFTTLGIYRNIFEYIFLEKSKLFYAADGVRRMSVMAVPDYLGHVQKRLNEEVERVMTYLDPSTRLPLLRILETELLQKHVGSLLEKGFDKLIDKNRVDDLSLMHNLFNRVDGIESERNAFSKYIKKTGEKIVNAKDQDKHMVQSLLDLKDKLDAILLKAFNKEESFTYALKNAFEYFINIRQNRPAEMLAKYVDQRLRTGRVNATNNSSSNASSNSSITTTTTSSTMQKARNMEIAALGGDDEMEALLNRVMVLFRYINGKDVFEAFYKKDLAKRLLLNKSASSDLEKGMISKLKTECGAAFTTKLEGMFKDMTLSVETMQSFQVSKQAKEYSNELDMHVHVLRTGFWPTYPPMEMQLPQAVLNAQKVFQSYYGEKYQGRKLYWQHSLATCTVKAKFPRSSHEFNVSLFQAAILVLFNNLGEGDEITYKNIKELVGIEEKELKRTLQSLACAKIRPIKKRPKGKDVNDNDYFIVAHDFKNARFKLKINQIQIRETKEENKEVNEKVFRDRLHQADACIVRIMKTRKTLSHSDLMSETLNQIKFPAKGSDIKKRIESLIDREYIERQEDNPQMYNYLA
jgi:cullin 4